ncbi:hypothetical protein ACLOJK_034108 [Asimina triloba]
MTNRLLPFLPQLEADLMSFSESAESSTRFLAMLAGPFYPILRIVNERFQTLERENTKTSGSPPDSDPLRNSQTPTLTVSSNFEAQPRRSRSPSPFMQPASNSIAFRPDAVFILLRKAYKDHQLGIVCRNASRALQKLAEPDTLIEASIPHSDLASSSVSADTAKPEGSDHLHLADYSSLFGEEFKIPNDNWDANFLNVLDLSAVEEGILHVLYACASQPPVSSPWDQFDDSLLQWKQPFVQQALSQIVAMASSSVYRPLLHACAGYLSSFQPSHVDLAIEILEGLLGTIQEVKHKLLFLVEMLDPFLDPAITAVKNTIAFGDVSAVFLEKQEHNCAVALDIIRTAIQRSAVLPSLEAEWRRGLVAPSVLLSILGPHMPLPAEIDHCKCPVTKDDEQESTTNSVLRPGIACKSSSQDESDGKADAQDMAAKMDVVEDAGLLFLPSELKSTMLSYPTNLFEGTVGNKGNSDSSTIDFTKEGKRLTQRSMNNQFQSSLILDSGFALEYFNLQADYLQLVNHQDCELRASEFQRLASELHSQHDLTPEGHDAAIDALLLAAECYVNPFFMMAFRATPKLVERMNLIDAKIPQKYDMAEIRRVSERHNNDLEIIADLESKRDKTVLQILLDAARMDRDYQKIASNGEQYQYYIGEDAESIEISSSDMESADAVTLVRQNQALLCQFLVQRLNKEQQSMHEILMQSLLFLLHSATQLFCAPENVIDIILASAGHLNALLTSFYHRLKEGNLQLDPERVHGVQRRWVLLQRLVVASSGCGSDGNFHATNSLGGFQYRSLIPPYSWTQRIPEFSSSPFPLVRFIGWMAISRYAKQYLDERLFLASDLTQMTSLLSIFADELALLDNLVDKNNELPKIEHSEAKPVLEHNNGFGPPEQAYGDVSFRVIYPDLHTFFPNMKRQFGGFGEIILEAIGIELKSLSSSAVPDALCWFSDFCVWPFHEIIKQSGAINTSDHLKGYSAKNAKAILLFVLEAIVSEHMEAMLPEIPRVVRILVSLCRSSYCDVAFLGSILRVLKPLISYALWKASEDEQLLEDESSCLNLESSCFSELLSNIRCRSEYQDNHAERPCRGALMIFILGALFSDLSLQRRGEILQSSLLWADFAISEPTSSFYDYLCGFQALMESCHLQLVQTLEVSGVLVPDQKQDVEEKAVADASSSFLSCFLDDAHKSQRTEDTDEFKKVKYDIIISNKKAHVLCPNEMEEFSKGLQQLISKVFPSIELCWKLHPQLAKKLTLTSAKCYMYSSCLSSIGEVSVIEEEDGANATTSHTGNQLTTNWRSALEVLVGVVLLLQQNHFWEVSSVIVDYLIGLPHDFCLDYVISTLCSAIKNFSCHAPRISWRLQTDKWLSALFSRGISNLYGEEASLIDLFDTMLGHSEPEQRSVAVNQLARLVGHNIRIGRLSYAVKEKSIPSEAVPESIVSLLVSSTWDKIAAMASSDPSMLLRTHAMMLLLDYIPFAQRSQLQSFLGEAEVILRGLGNLAYPMREGPLTRLSLALLAGTCLYSPAEDIALIPESVWRNLETIGMSKSEGRVGAMEKKACQALCRLRTEGDDAKEVLKEALSSHSATEPSDPNFGSTRESILQVLSTLTSAQSYFDFFLKRMDQEAMELEEAEIEMDVLQEEKALQDAFAAREKSRLKEEIAARRQKKLLLRRTRQKYLEEAALRETELLKELDRERTSEMEHEIERKRQLEVERAKTRELRHNLDMERERQTQRDLQRELEQAESGVRPSRREFSSSSSGLLPVFVKHLCCYTSQCGTMEQELSNPLCAYVMYPTIPLSVYWIIGARASVYKVPCARGLDVLLLADVAGCCLESDSRRALERFRERENGRVGQEGSLRPSSRGRDGGATSTSTAGSSGAINSMATVVLTGSRSFSGQPPTILQSRDRSEDRSGAYEDNLDGSRDSGDTGSIGDPDLSSAFDGPAGGFGSTQRQGSRGSKSRQVMERRERDGRREGKWERKHS